jgi:maltooligosyltrehalose trehalohydrolase
MSRRWSLGATLLEGGSCRFLVWAPSAEEVSLYLVDEDRRLRMVRDGRGYHSLEVERVGAGTRYTLSLGGGPQRPDPASRLQPEGVHGPSAVVSREFRWNDDRFRPRPLDRHVFYELHVGTFSRAGTFEGVIEHLEYLRELGVTAIELLPISQFPGTRNWGYDGVLPFAAQNSYGGPDGLKRLVNAAHQKGLSVWLDVVYNHMGPEGNYLGEFGPYFTDKHSTPWGRALNFSEGDSDEVRRFFIESALYWVDECHIDGLRLDAVHAIVDPSPLPFVQELAAAVQRRGEELGRRVSIVAESAANDARLITPRELGGIGLDAQWNDDFHHAALAPIRKRGINYDGYDSPQQLLKAVTDGYVFSGEYSRFFRRRHGSPSRALPAERFIVFVQNHDQVGNQPGGERITDIAGFEAAKLAAGLMLLSPYVPLLFMGEEYAEAAPFQYFVDHGDEALLDAVRRGRREEFRLHGWGDGEAPDPADAATFERSKLNHALRESGRHRAMLELYRILLRLRREIPALARLSKDHLEASLRESPSVLVLRRWHEDSRVVAAFNLSDQHAEVSLRLADGAWNRLIDSADKRFAASGTTTPEQLSGGAASIGLPPHSFVCYGQDGL